MLSVGKLVTTNVFLITMNATGELETSRLILTFINLCALTKFKITRNANKSEFSFYNQIAEVGAQFAGW